MPAATDTMYMSNLLYLLLAIATAETHISFVLHLVHRMSLVDLFGSSAVPPLLHIRPLKHLHCRAPNLVSK